MKKIYVGLLAGIIAVSVLSIPVVADAGNGGFYSGGVKHQAEAREDDHYGFSCSSYYNACFGGCGPGCWTVAPATSACVAHDSCIRDYRCAGYSAWSAHYYCLTGSRGLTRAAGSAIGYHWNNFTSKVADVVTGIWNWIW